MFPEVIIFVKGDPKGQPRPRAFARGGMVRMYDPGTAEGWKSAIADEWRRSAPKFPKIAGPVSVELQFFFARPKAHFTKRGLRDDAPRCHAKKPDADNLAKAVCDCLTQLGIWEDDDQVTSLVVRKWYTYTDVTGCRLILKPDGDHKDLPAKTENHQQMLLK